MFMSNQRKALSRAANCIRLLAAFGGLLFSLIRPISEILHSQVRKMDGNHNLNVFSDTPIRKAVAMQVIPAVASQMITLVYNLADTYFVGMLNAPHETAAITVVYPSFLMLTAISNLFGVGGASAIARALGRQDEEGAKRISAISIWGGLISSLAFSLLFLLLADPVLHLCGATEDTYEIAFGYAKWVVILGGPFTILNTLMANLVRAEGGAGAAAFGVSFGGILNIILDPLFVLPQFLGQGAVGAGAATALSNAAAVFYFLLYLIRHRKSSYLHLSPVNLRYAPQYLRPVLTIGFPSALQYALTVVATAAQAKFVSQYPTEAVAALGIVKKLDQLPLYFSIGVSNGLLPLLAYNHAAGKQKRREQAFRLGSLVSFAFAVLCLVCYELFAGFLTSLFIQDAVTTQYGAAFLRCMVTAMPMMALCYPMIIQFQAMGQAKASLVCSILRKGVLDIPLLFVMDALFPLYGCMWVQPIVDTISLAVALHFYREIQKNVLAAKA